VPLVVHVPVLTRLCLST